MFLEDGLDSIGTGLDVVVLDKRAGIEAIERQSLGVTIGTNLIRHRSWNTGGKATNFGSRHRIVSVARAGLDILMIQPFVQHFRHSRSNRYMDMLLLGQAERLKRPEHTLLINRFNRKCHIASLRGKPPPGPVSCSCV